MKRFSAVFAVLASILILTNPVMGDYKGKNKYGVDIFTIDLDLAEEQRFVEVSNYYKDFTVKILNQYMNLVPYPILLLAQKLGGIIYWIQPEYYLEIQGMANTIGVDTNALLLAQYINEFSAFCTSVVAYDSNGVVFHGRNMDFLFPDTMRNITYQGEFYQNGKYLFTAVMYAGLNGVTSGWRDGWSITINNRKPSDRTSPIALIENISLIFLGAKQNLKVIRDTLTACDTYACALNMLSTVHQIAPSYYAIAGNETYQGAIITRDRFGPAHVEILSKDQWYIAQTNDDHWTGVCTLRCQYVIDNMNQIGRDNITPELLRNILVQWPSNNEHSIYNTLIIPAQSFFEVKTIENDKPAPI